MDQGAHFQTNQKPLTVMNVHNRARNHLSVGVRERERQREREKEREGCGLMEFSNQMTEKQKQPFL